MWITSLLCCTLVQGAGAPPNVVVILMDDVGRDKVRAYMEQPGVQPTPNLNALAARGVLFRNAWAYQACSPTRAALLTGRHSDRTGIGKKIRNGDGVYTPLSLREITIPEALPGYTSVAVGKWDLDDLGAPLTHPIDSGFDLSIGWEGLNDYVSWTYNVNGALRPASGYYPPLGGEHVIDVLKSTPEPFFVYYCPMMAHSPFHVPPQDLHTRGNPTDNRGRHQAMVESLDTIIGRILHFVDLETTYVIVLGDNGSPSGTVFPPFIFSQVKGTVYEGGVRVPMIIAGPGVAQGQECEELVHVVDLFSTIREVAGLGPATQGAEDSVSFASLLANPQAAGARETLYVHEFPFPGLTGADTRALRTKRWKVIERIDEQRCELYDLLADPFEANDLLVSQPGPVTTQLKDRLLRLMPVFP